MPIAPHLPIVAVFGKNDATQDELTAAEVLSLAIRRAGAVLLTGGDLLANRTKDVKDRAIFATEEAASPGEPAKWIGVARKPAADRAQWRGPESVVVTPGWSHRRNFVEACICDAAIAIGGASDGTASEVVFSLYLGRPLVILGALPENDQHLSRLLDRAKNRIPEPAQPVLAVDRGIRGAYGWAKNDPLDLDVRPLPSRQEHTAVLLSELFALATSSTRVDFDHIMNERDWDDFVGRALHDAGRH